jgi:mannose-6-phosphate isomerase-like protein (cupin superfamily)
MFSRASVPLVAAASAGIIVVLAMACAPRHSMREPFADSACGTAPASRVLAENAGERRVRRPPPNATSPGLPFTVKVDCESVGATDLYMSYEELPLGGRITPHRHPHMDEILIIRGGSGVASLAGAETAVAEGGMVYIARNTVVSLRNTGTVPLRIAFILPHTGMGTYLREWSVPDGQRVIPLSATENATRRARASWLQIFEQ